MVVDAFLVIIAIAFVAGLFGAYAIARYLSGGKVIAAFLVWLVLPILVLAVFFSATIDPTLSAERARNNFAMAMALTLIVVTIPWLVANLIGGLIGRWRRRVWSRRRSPPTIADRAGGESA